MYLKNCSNTTFNSIDIENNSEHSSKQKYKKLVTVPDKSLENNNVTAIEKSDTVLSDIKVTKSALFIVARPWADVFINGKYHETTPINKSIMLDPGVHFIELKNPNYYTFVKEYNLKSALSETLMVNLKLKNL